LTFVRECVSMHVMQYSNAAVARGEKVSPQGSGLRNRTKRTTFIGCDLRTVEVDDIAAIKGLEFTAGAGFTPAVN
jgi:hypothetical protein